MQKIFQNSVFIRALSAIYTWFGVQWRNSFFVNLFLKPFSGDGDNIFRKYGRFFSVFYTVYFTHFVLTNSVKAVYSGSLSFGLA